MKYGESLSARSIPEWLHHNVDYDTLKQYIKAHTSERNAPDKSTDSAANLLSAEKFASTFYRLLSDQHNRISLFFRSKLHEITCSLDRVSSQINRFRAKSQAINRVELSAKQLEVLAHLEDQLIRIGCQIQNLSRFATAQRIAFEKLLKKYRRWTNDDALCMRFRNCYLKKYGTFSDDRYNSLPDLLISWTRNLSTLRSLLIESSSRNVSPAPIPVPKFPPIDPSIIQSNPLYHDTSKLPGNYETNHISLADRISEHLKSGSFVDFDTTFESYPLCPRESLYVYWIHPDNLIEFHVALSLHLRIFDGPDASVCRSQSSDNLTSAGLITKPSLQRGYSELNLKGSRLQSSSPAACLVIDHLPTFAQSYANLAIESWQLAENRLMTTQGIARWVDRDDIRLALAESAFSTPESNLNNSFPPVTVSLKQKQLLLLFNSQNDSPSYHPNLCPESTCFSASQDWFLVKRRLREDPLLTPLVTIRSKRCRYTSFCNDKISEVWATLDEDIHMMKSCTWNDLSVNSSTGIRLNSQADLASPSSPSKQLFSFDHDTLSVNQFPYAVLTVRYISKTDAPSNEPSIIDFLDNSHLAENVKGFDLKYHAIWKCYKPSALPDPHWVAQLSIDIRKSPRINRELSSIRDTSVPYTARLSLHASRSKDPFGLQSVNPVDPKKHFMISEATSSDDALGVSKLNHLEVEGSSSDTPLSQMSSDAVKIQSVKYWNEYDNARNLYEQDSSYWLYFDSPEAKSMSQEFRNFFRNVWNSVFKATKDSDPEQQPLLSSSPVQADTNYNSISSPSWNPSLFSSNSTNLTAGSNTDEPVRDPASSMLHYRLLSSIHAIFSNSVTFIRNSDSWCLVRSSMLLLFVIFFAVIVYISLTEAAGNLDMFFLQ